MTFVKKPRGGKVEIEEYKLASIEILYFQVMCEGLHKSINPVVKNLKK